VQNYELKNLLSYSVLFFSFTIHCRCLTWLSNSYTRSRGVYRRFKFQTKHYTHSRYQNIFFQSKKNSSRFFKHIRGINRYNIMYYTLLLILPKQVHDSLKPNKSLSNKAVFYLDTNPRPLIFFHFYYHIEINIEMIGVLKIIS
jgi:hypothetical protein